MKFSDITNVKILGLPLGRSSGKMPKDGDGDGMYTAPGSDEDNVPLGAARDIARRVLKRDKNSYIAPNVNQVRAMAESVKEPDSGFTKEKLKLTDVPTGISIARNKHGIKFKNDELFDEDGEPRDEAIETIFGFLEFHGQQIFNNPAEGAREVGLGGWHDPDTGDVYFDIVDIYDNPHGPILPDDFKQQMYDLGKGNNQISIANLDAISADDWDNAIIKTDGNGAETISLDVIRDFGKRFPNKIKGKKSLLTTLFDSGTIVVQSKEGI